MTLSLISMSTSMPGMSPRFIAPPSVPHPPLRQRVWMEMVGSTIRLKSITSIRSQVGLKPESDSDVDLESKMEMVGSTIRLKSPLKVYHVPRVPELELPAGTEGTIKNYVGFWKGKRISANLPFKVQFQIDVPGRGPLNLMAHLKDDEFEVI